MTSAPIRSPLLPDWHAEPPIPTPTNFPAGLPAREAEFAEICHKDHMPCYAGMGLDAHWRCGTVQCGPPPDGDAVRRHLDSRAELRREVAVKVARADRIERSIVLAAVLFAAIVLCVVGMAVAAHGELFK